VERERERNYGKKLTLHSLDYRSSHSSKIRGRLTTKKRSSQDSPREKDRKGNATSILGFLFDATATCSSFTHFGNSTNLLYQPLLTRFCFSNLPNKELRKFRLGESEKFGSLEIRMTTEKPRTVEKRKRIQDGEIN